MGVDGSASLTAAVVSGAAALVATRLGGLPLEKCVACAIAGATATGLALATLQYVAHPAQLDAVNRSEGSTDAATKEKRMRAAAPAPEALQMTLQTPAASTASPTTPTRSRKDSGGTTPDSHQSAPPATPQSGGLSAVHSTRTIEEQLWDAWTELPSPRAKSKELKETLAFFNAVKKTLFPKGTRRRKVLVDVGGGNAYLSWVFLSYGRSKSPSATEKLPEDTGGLRRPP